MGQGFSSGLVSNWDTANLREQLAECQASKSGEAEAEKPNNVAESVEAEKANEGAEAEKANEGVEAEKANEGAEAEKANEGAEAEKANEGAEAEKANEGAEAEKTNEKPSDVDDAIPSNKTNKSNNKANNKKPNTAAESDEESEPLVNTNLAKKLRNGGEQVGGANKRNQKHLRAPKVTQRQRRNRRRMSRKSTVDGKPIEP